MTSSSNSKSNYESLFLLVMIWGSWNMFRDWKVPWTSVEAKPWLSSVTGPGPDDGSRAGIQYTMCTGSRVWVPGHEPGFRHPAPGRAQTSTLHFGARALVQCVRAYGSFIYYTNAHLPHAREFSAYAREHINRKLPVASWPGRAWAGSRVTTKSETPCPLLMGS